MFMLIRRRNTSIPFFWIRRYHINNNNNSSYCSSSSSSTSCNGGLRPFLISSQKLINPPSNYAYSSSSFKNITTTSCSSSNHHKWAVVEEEEEESDNAWEEEVEDDDDELNPQKLIIPSSYAAAYSSSSFKTTTTNHQKWAEEEQEDEESDNAWEEEDDDDDELNPRPGDARAGGGVLLNSLPWGQRALSVAHELLSQFGPDFKLFAFRTTPRGYIYLRLDKLPNQYGCPSIDELQSYHREYKTRLDQLGATGEIPDHLAIEVSSPGAHRLLKVPDDLDRFKQLPMRVCYVQDLDPKAPLKNGVFLLESVDTESGHCVWKLANVRENREISGKGRPLNRKQKDWRLNLPYAMFKKVTLYLD